ncbi:MAG: 50S ribosomal protein L30 [Anaerolineae bacterium]|nr:50S ribosomal protein L30 [Thermoflexales bacterium]MDW8408453.1 50S ribosomal protein L30 [Anaerolineae bacterium]
MDLSNNTTGRPKRLIVRWVKSAAGYSIRQKRTIKALGFRRLGQAVQHDDTPQVRGMVHAVSHLVEVQEQEQTDEVA